ncbi:MAG: amidase [Burkholderiaceae bacterium]
MIELPARMTQLQEQIRCGKVSVVQAMETQRRKAKGLHAQYACVAQEREVVAAKDGPLKGIVLAHKDIFELPGRQPGCGVNAGTISPTTVSADPIAKLEQAGASQWASLVMTPFACGATSQNRHFPRCVNPIDKDAVVGGSSSGSAVAVAAGISYVAMGTDTAGSVRIPAATCGLLGLKTTYGLIDKQGCFPLAPSMDTIGLLARYSEDARQILTVLAPDLRSASQVLSCGKSKPTCRAWLPHDLNSDLRTAISNWLSQIDVVEWVDLTEDVDLLSRHAQRVLLFETSQTHYAALVQDCAESGVQIIGRQGLGLPEPWYQHSIDQRTALLQGFVDRYFKSASFLILPAFLQPIPDWWAVEVGDERFDRNQLIAMYSLMGFVNYLGLPAITLPIAQDERGRPIHVQVLARPFSEHHLLDFAASVETIFRMH